MKSQDNVKGFSLPIVMIMMLALAILVLAATQLFNTESRLSSNDADRKMTMQIAEAALRQGEQAIVDQDLVEQIVYRVTARAWGENTNTVVTLQSYVAADI